MGKTNENKNTKVEIEELALDIKEDAEIFTEFLSETYDHLEDSESNILSIEEDSFDLELVNAIFRSIHSIKGSTGFLGLANMQKLSHELETLLDKVRKGEISINQKILNVCLSSIDVLRKLRDNLSIRVDRELGKIADSASKEQPINIQPSIDGILSIINKEEGPEEIEEDKKEDQVGEILLDDGVVTQEQLDKALKDKGRKIGEILVDQGATTPKKIGKALEEQKPLGEVLVEKGAITKPQLKEALNEQDRMVGEILVEDGAAASDKVNAALQAQQDQRKARVQSRTVKVDTEKLDSLFDMVGELVISNTLITGEMKSITNNMASKNLSQLNKITKDIQDKVMSMRMVPLKQTFQKMARLVRDVSMQAGKKIKLSVSGEETELDKNVIEEIADPLVHLLRNSVDHGVEPEKERIAKGKPGEGHILLNAFHKGGNIVIEIDDDGRGLQKEKILNKALEKGLIKDKSGISDSQIYNLIFAPGFSTADKITNISGRGVGTDVVKKNIEKLRGKVEVASTEGNGSKFTIRLPLTLAIIDGIVVKVGNATYILPTISIEESLSPKKEDISTIKEQGEVVNMRGTLFPLVRLHKLYNINGAKTNPCEAIVVVVESDQGRYSILVDELLGQQQVVIKSLGERFKNVKGISGGAIMGDGKVGLILDVSGIREASLD